jgi:hypothetical protein
MKEIVKNSINQSIEFTIIEKPKIITIHEQNTHVHSSPNDAYEKN